MSEGYITDTPQIELKFSAANHTHPQHPWDRRWVAFGFAGSSGVCCTPTKEQDLSERNKCILRRGVNHILHEVFSIVNRKSVNRKSVNRKSVNRKSFCFSLLRFFGGAKK